MFCYSINAKLHQPRIAIIRAAGRSASEQQFESIAPTLVVEEQPKQTAVLLRRPNRHGDTIVAPETRHPLRNLHVHNRQVPVFREEQEGLAELHQAQPQFERVLREGAPGGRRRAQGQLLDARFSVRGHVRERELQAAEAHEEALQERAALPEGLLRGHAGAARFAPREEYLFHTSVSPGVF